MTEVIHYFLWLVILVKPAEEPHAWIRVNLLGYHPELKNVAVWCSKNEDYPTTFQVLNQASGKVIVELPAGKPMGAYGPFKQTCRLNFSPVTEPGKYIIRAGGIDSPVITIGYDVYNDAPNFALRYIRQQRSKFNPFLKDSCHTHDGYTLYGPMPDSTHVDVSGGWHDASDYLQYSATSAMSTYYLLAAYRNSPYFFKDNYQANGLAGKNGIPDVLDEAKWGLEWLMKMHPRDDWMFNQIADDRDHIAMRIPGQDRQYGKGLERPVYFINGKPQIRGKFLNNTTGTSSTAAKLASAFALGSEIFRLRNPAFSRKLKLKAFSAYEFARKKLGVTQTASVRSPYIYAEENWVDDMELAAACLARIAEQPEKYRNEAIAWAKQEPITPWLGQDTASHYQWYPFTNPGHHELMTQYDLNDQKDYPEIVNLITYYLKGIERVEVKARKNAFLRGIPFIWCSNNLTVSFGLQCKWSISSPEIQQSTIDWIFGNNPWGTSMVYGLPAGGDFPSDPHSAFTHLKKFPIDGGMVDGPVYTSIYKNLIGIQLNDADEYSAFQSDLAVYHDDYGDYSTNEPTLDGTASLVYLLSYYCDGTRTPLPDLPITSSYGADIRADTSFRTISLVFTGDEYSDGGKIIRKVLKERNVKASFFLTGNFYRNSKNKSVISGLQQDGHYLGPHSDKHLLYCDWKKRDSLLVSKAQFKADLKANFDAMSKFGFVNGNVRYFLPPYEWYNDSIASWTKQEGCVLINYSPGTLSHADYTTPEMSNYKSSDVILQSIYEFEKKESLNGFILLMHIGTDPKRKDKLYNRLGELIDYLKQRDYEFQDVQELFDNR